MSDIDYLIKYERENTKLDFKKEEYPKEKYDDLIKDIVAMANAPVEGKRYIIIGVKEKSSGAKDFFPIDEEKMVDQATYQQLIRSNVEPYIEVSYYPHYSNDDVFGVIEIAQSSNPPHIISKDRGKIKKGDCHVRKGSQQEKMTRRDLDEILEFKSRTYVNNDIDIGFNNSLEKTLVVSGVKELNPPSKNKAKEVKEILDKRASMASERNNNFNFAPLKISYPNFGQPVPLKDQSTDRLKEILRNPGKEYKEYDWHYLSEKVSERINLIISNEGEEYLEDANIILKIPKEQIYVMDKIHEEPSEGLSITSVKGFSSLYYPEVIEQDENFIVKHDIGEVRHHQKMEVFDKDLRIYFPKKSINEIYEWSYIIHARNLPKPISGKLKVEVID